MKVNALTNKNGRVLKLSAFTLLLVLGALLGWRGLAISGTDLAIPVHAQQDVMLDRRISQVEQRFYYIESRLNQLENQSRYPGVLPGSGSTSQIQLSQMRTEVETLRAEMDSLRSRVGEAECGLIKIDERTLTPAARQTRRQNPPGSSEPCRRDPNSPVKLSARP